MKSKALQQIKQAEDALDLLWDEGVLNESVMEEWKREHMRTPYKH